MDEKELRAFLVAADEMSISSAADFLSTSQSVLSKRIAKLEETLKVKLFERGQKKLSLTEYGRIFLPYAMSALNALVAMRETVHQTMQSAEKQLNIGIVEYIGLYVFHGFLESFREMHPDIRVSIWYMQQAMNFSQLSNHPFDIFISGMGYQPVEGFKFIPLWRQELDVMVRKDHPLTKIKAPTIEEIIRYPCVATPTFMPSRQALDRFMLKRGIHFNPKHEADIISSQFKLAKAEQAWCLIPSFLHDPEMITIFHHEELSVEFVLFYRSNLMMTESIQLFLDEFKNACAIED